LYLYWLSNRELANSRPVIPQGIAYRPKMTTSPSGFMLTYRRRTSVVGSLTKMPSGVNHCGVRLTPPSGIMTSWW
jgi:hypothetical protein